MFEELDQLLSSDLFEEAQQGEIIELHEGERREVCILFADIKGFTALSEQLDPEQVRIILDKLLQVFTLCIKQYGGYIDKYEGDLVMALFGAKVASEQDTERAIHAALRMLDTLTQFNALLAKNPVVKGIELGVRIGINTGLVTTGKIGEKREGDFTVYGDAVNIASRMESNAPVNRIMIPKDTMQRVKDVFDCEDHGAITVKGKSKPISVFLLQGVKAHPVQRWQIARSAYVGRENELAVLNEKYDQAAQRLSDVGVETPVVVGIKAPAGLGKSRLLDEFLHSKREHVCVVHGTTPRIAQNPYCVFTSLVKDSLKIAYIDSPSVLKEKLETGFQALETALDDADIQRLRSMLPMMGYLLGVKYDDPRLQLEGKELQPYLQTAIRYFLEAVATKANRAGQPLVVILEDLQWLDEASHATLEFLMNTLNLEAQREQKPCKHLLFFLVYRPEYIIPQDVTTKAAFSEIELHPLNESEAEQLILSMSHDLELPPDVKHQLLEKSTGNPFYLEEWVHLISETPHSLQTLEQIPVPKSLNALILSRIDRLEYDLKLLLQKAAVIGREFFVEILAEIEKKLQHPEDISVQLDHLEARDFVRRMLGSTYSTYFFKHIITQEVAYNTLLMVNRKILHRITAEVIEKRFASNIEEFYYDLAEHYSKAEVKEKAFEYLKKAGEKARANYENQKAIWFYDQVNALARRQGDDETVIDYLLKKGWILWLIGKWDEQQKTLYEEALHLAEGIHHRKYIPEAKWALGRFYWLNGDHENALRYLREAMTGFETIHDKQGMGRTVSCMGNVYKELLKNYTEATACYQQAIHLFEEVNDTRGVAGVTCNMGGLYAQQGDSEHAITCYQTVIEMNEASGNDKFLFALSGYGLGFTHHFIGNYDIAMTYYEQSLNTSQEVGSKWLISLGLGRIGFIHGEKGHYDEAIVCYDRAIALAEELHREFFLSMGLINKAEALFHLQDFGEAQVINTRSLKIAKKVGFDEGVFRSRILSAKIDHALGQQEDAKNHLSDMLTHTEHEEEIARLHYELWKIGGQEEHRQAALERYRTLYTKPPKFRYEKQFGYERRIEELSFKSI